MMLYDITVQGKIHFVHHKCIRTSHSKPIVRRKVKNSILGTKITIIQFRWNSKFLEEIRRSNQNQLLAKIKFSVKNLSKSILRYKFTQNLF